MGVFLGRLGSLNIPLSSKLFHTDKVNEIIKESNEVAVPLNPDNENKILE